MVTVMIDCSLFHKLMKKFKLKYKNVNEWPRKMEPIYADWHGDIRSMEPIRWNSDWLAKKETPEEMKKQN